MPKDNPPQPPSVDSLGRTPSSSIADVRDLFARKTPPTERDRTEAKAFIDGKIEMIRRDQQMTEAQKAESIAGLQALSDAT